MKDLKLYLVTVALLGGLAACDSGSGPDSSIPDLTDGRITIVTDPDKLDDRITLEDEDILTDTTGLGKAGDIAAFNLDLIASVSPPSVDGATVMATSASWNSSFAYISYNLRGSAYAGAVDVIQVQGKGNVKIKGTIAIPGSDINSVYYHNNYVFVAEASAEAAFDPLTSVVERVPATGNDKFDVVGALRTPLQSFVATSVYGDGSNVYVTTGSTGFIYRLDITTMAVQDSAALDDARWVHGDASSIVVLQGTPGRISVRDKTTLAEVATYALPVPSATIAESKSTVEVIGGKALIAAGDGGVKLVNLATGNVVGSIARITGVPGLTDDKTVSNAVSGAGQYVFVSNGEAGVYVYRASQSLNDLSGDAAVTFTNLGHFKFSSSESVNHVAYDGQFLVVASGLGGIKLLEVTF